MNEFVWLILAVAGGFIWWKTKKDRAPAVLGELVITLRILADARNEPMARKYRAIADLIERGKFYAASGTKPEPQELKEIRAAIMQARDENLLFTLGFGIASGRQKQAQDALFSMWEKIEP